MATIYDVAERAGVSIATVSRTLRGEDCVSDAVRARVLGAADELGYRPNRLARALAEGRTHALGLVLPESLTNPFYAQLAESIVHSALPWNYDVVLTLTTGGSVQDYVDTVVSLGERQIEGLLLCAGQETVQACMDVRSAGSPPLVAIGCPPGVGAPLVTIDEEAAGHALTRHLLDLGHTRVAFLCLDHPACRPGGREHGYLRAMEEAGLAPLLHSGPATFDGGLLEAPALLAESPDVTALVAFNDAAAIGALCGLRDAGKRVPDDVSVVGFDDIPQSRYCSPPLTTMALPVAEMAEQAVALLCQAIAHLNDGSLYRPIFLAPSLIRRESCRALPRAESGSS
jgi:LacI family transcriptional regulator